MTHLSSPSHNKIPSWFHYTNTTKRIPMKRLSSSDSLIPICPSGDEKGVAYEELGDEELLCYVGGGGAGEKKRRLSVDQVRALEKNFEVENKLEPERKTKLAQELGLQPRQVAVWFQNRRARWKTKQLERDYNVLKDTYDALLVDHDVLFRDKEALLAEIKELKAKLANESPNPTYSSIKEEENNKASEEPPAPTYKDRSSDSDSSAVLNDVLNDENSPHEVAAAAMAFESSPLFPTSSHKGVFIYQHQPQLMEVVEDEGFIGGDESCSSFFFDEQVTSSLPWYYSEKWN